MVGLLAESIKFIAMQYQYKGETFCLGKFFATKNWMRNMCHIETLLYNK